MSQGRYQVSRNRLVPFAVLGDLSREKSNLDTEILWRYNFGKFKNVFKIQNFRTPCGLTSRKRLPPVSDHLGLTFSVVAYGRFDCI